MATVKFPGIEENLTAPNTPWIYYGVSLPFNMSLVKGLSNLYPRDPMLVPEPLI